MPKQKLNKTKYPGIFWYETKKGKLYAIRVRYKDIYENWKEKTEQGFTSLNQARSRKSELENSISSETNSKITFGDWWLKHLEITNPTWSRDTYVSVKSIHKNHLSVFDNIELSKLTLFKYQQFINKKLHEDNLALASVKEIHRKMMSIINSAVKHDYLIKNKLKDVTIQKFEVVKKKHLTLEELSKLDALAHDRLSVTQYACYVLLRIGWRRGEVLGITRGAINIVDDSTVEVSVVQTKTPQSYINTPKTQSSYRTNVLLDDFARAIIKAVEVAEKIHNNVLSDSSRIIVNGRGVTQSPGTVNAFLRKLSIDLGVHVNPHMLRHSFATHAIANNASVVEVSKWIGHANTQMTLNRYSHSSEKARSELVRLANTPQNTSRNTS